MMTSPFYSELPPDLADDSVWRASQGGRETAAAGRSDAEDFKLQVQAARPMLNRMARRLLRNPVLAEDAVSETVVAALERPGSLAGPPQLRGGKAGWSGPEPGTVSMQWQTRSEAAETPQVNAASCSDRG